MDRLRQDDLDRARQMAPEEKLGQALEMMRAGIRLRRAGLRAAHPAASDAEVDAMLACWLERDD